MLWAFKSAESVPSWIEGYLECPKGIFTRATGARPASKVPVRLVRSCVSVPGSMMPVPDSDLLRTSEHIINQRTIDIRTARTDRIEERLVISHIVAGIHQLVCYHMVITGLAEHHEAAHH